MVNRNTKLLIIILVLSLVTILQCGTTSKKQVSQSSTSLTGTTTAKVNDGIITDTDRYVNNPENITFPEGKSSVMVQKDGKYYGYVKSIVQAIIDSNGNVVTFFDKKIFHLEGFSEGVSAYIDKASRKFGYVDKKGNVVIQPQFNAAGPFINGIAVVRKGKLKGVIDRSGNFIIQPAYQALHNFYHPQYTFAKKPGDRSYRILNRNGSVSRAVFSNSETSFIAYNNPWLTRQIFNSGRVRYKSFNKYGYRDLKGNVAIKAIYDKASHFRHGLARVGKKSSRSQPAKYGVINPAGKAVISLDHKYTSTPMQENYNATGRITIGAFKNKQCMIYDSNGRVVFGPASQIGGRECMYISAYKNGYAKVRLRDLQNKPRRSTLWQATVLFIDHEANPYGYGEPVIAENLNRNGLAFYCNYDPTTLLTSYDSKKAREKAEQMNKNNPRQCGFINHKSEKVASLNKQVGMHGHNLSNYSGLNDQLNYSESRRIIALGGKGNLSYLADTGAVLEKKPFSGAVEFSATMVPFCKQDSSSDRCGYIELKTGKVKIPPAFRNAAHFRDGVAVISAYSVIKKEL